MGTCRMLDMYIKKAYLNKKLYILSWGDSLSICYVFKSLNDTVPGKVIEALV